jgi:hypothetical protein
VGEEKAACGLILAEGTIVSFACSKAMWPLPEFSMKLSDASEAVGLVVLDTIDDNEEKDDEEEITESGLAIGDMHAAGVLGRTMFSPSELVSIASRRSEGADCTRSSDDAVLLGCATSCAPRTLWALLCFKGS